MIQTNVSITYPFTFFFQYQGDWSSTHNYDYWNKTFTDKVGVNNAISLKTIYDPSPYRFVCPKTAAFTGFTSDGENHNNANNYYNVASYDNGWYFYTNGWKNGATIHMVCLGIREVWTGRVPGGTLNFVGTSSCYWLCGASSQTTGYATQNVTTFVRPHDGTLARGFGNSFYPSKE